MPCTKRKRKTNAIVTKIQSNNISTPIRCLSYLYYIDKYFDTIFSFLYFVHILEGQHAIDSHREKKRNIFLMLLWFRIRLLQQTFLRYWNLSFTGTITNHFSHQKMLQNIFVLLLRKDDVWIPSAYNELKYEIFIQEQNIRTYFKSLFRGNYVNCKSIDYDGFGVFGIFAKSDLDWPEHLKNCQNSFNCWVDALLLVQQDELARLLYFEPKTIF